MQCVVRIECEDRERRAAAQATAERLGLRIAGAGNQASGDDMLSLAMRDDGWELRDESMRPGRGVCIDFTTLARRGPHRAKLSRRQPLARAVGRDAQRVIDATAGLGQDAALLAAMGYKVTAIERHAILAAMLEEALDRALADVDAARLLGDRLSIVHADARLTLARIKVSADCVYLDPMFPPKRKKSALPAKEIRLVRALVGDDDDAADLLAAARRVAPRVAVKRPHHAPPLANDVHATIESNLVRYDIYRGLSAAAG